MISERIRMAGMTGTAVLLMSLSAFGQDQALKTEGKTFQDFTIAENDNFVMTASCDDTDLSDGYIWDITLQNKGTADYVIAVQNPAINNIMCDTDEWSVSGWELSGGDTMQDAVIWTVPELTKKGISDVGKVSFFLKVYKKGAYSGIAGVCIDEMVSVLVDQKALDGQKSTKEEKSTPAFLDNSECTLKYLSEDADEDGMPIWHVVIENHTEKTEMYEIHDAVLNGWAVEPYWSQIILPGCKAYADISWWTLDADADALSGLENADFYIKTWKVQNGWTPGYSDEKSYAASLPVPEGTAVPEAETEEEPSEGETGAENAASEDGAEAETDLPEDAAEAETDLPDDAAEAETDLPEDAAEAENTSPEEGTEPENAATGDGTETEITAEEETSPAEEKTLRELSEDEEPVFKDEVFQAALRQLEYDREDDIVQLDFYLENISDNPVLFAVEEIRCGDTKIPAAWNSRLPANSRRNSSIYLDLNQLEGEAETAEITFTVRRLGKENPETVICTFDLEAEKMTLAQSGGETETGEEAEETENIREAETETENIRETETEPDIISEAETETENIREAETEPGTVSEEETETENIRETETEPGTEEAVSGAAEDTSFDSADDSDHNPETETEAAPDAPDEAENTAEGDTETGEETVDEPDTDVQTGEDKQSGQEDETEAKTVYTDEDTVRNLQAALTAAGYDCGQSDGKIGENTLGQMRKYREDKGLSASDDIDDEILFSLGVADSETYKKVQEALNESNFDCGTPDGLLGSKTREAVRAFRETYRIGSGDGIDEELLKRLGIR